MKYYTLQYLLKKLKAEKLVASRRQFIRLEKQGIIPRPTNILVYKLKKTALPGNTRIYNQAEIKTIISIVRKYSNGKKTKV